MPKIEQTKNELERRAFFRTFFSAMITIKEEQMISKDTAMGGNQRIVSDASPSSIFRLNI